MKTKPFPKILRNIFAYIIFNAYLCNQVHAEAPLVRGGQVVGIILGQRLTTPCFWSFEPRKFKRYKSRTLQSRCYGVGII